MKKKIICVKDLISSEKLATWKGMSVETKQERATPSAGFLAFGPFA